MLQGAFSGDAGIRITWDASLKCWFLGPTLRPRICGCWHRYLHLKEHPTSVIPKSTKV